MADKIISHKIIVAGIGPGNPAYMVPEAVQAIEKAQVLVGGKRALAQFAASEAGKQKTMAIGGDIPAVMNFIGEKTNEYITNHDWSCWMLCAAVFPRKQSK